MGAIQDGPLFTPALRQPRSLREAWELKSGLGDRAVYVSGGTLLRTQWEAGTAAVPQVLIDLRKIAGMGDMIEAEGYLTAGSLVTLAACRSSSALASAGPAAAEAARQIAAPAVRNLATLGGNIASGYGDMLPALLVHDAEIAVYDGEFLSVQPVEAWLERRWSGSVPPGELVAGIRLPRRETGGARLAICRKVGRREAFTASLVTAALAADWDAGSRTLRGVRLAAGGGSGRPQRLAAAEALLEDAELTHGLLGAVYEAVESGFASYDDPFASEAYKQKTAGNLIAAELWRLLESE
ncbi:FAD binding domain-containing protein [Paenibacillus tengchongensis]|uniref:FAD binding domain-containing protein n=1 Tax=Paenibacillus tengchongensis TaxID=2608684 RepID=UPI001651BDBF|nr:FAD binding domain-containing protein [Paenibacillus tengchongensis]